jgi:hypothetical protein
MKMLYIPPQDEILLVRTETNLCNTTIPGGSGEDRDPWEEDD